MDGPQWPMVFDIAMGVRRGEAGFKQEIDHELARNRSAIDAILAQYNVPGVADPTEAAADPALRPGAGEPR